MAPRKKSITPKYFGQGGVSDKIPRIAYTANALRFQSEEDLEIYIENHFDELFPDLELLQRQFRLKTNRYDLLCRHKHTHQAVILELKNEEDRSIIWQLVRYRKLIITERPFSEQIDYSLPVELIAIAPSFHEDSLIDKEACKFEENIKLQIFKLDVQEKILSINNIDHVIPYRIIGLSEEAVSDFTPTFLTIQEKAPTLASFMDKYIFPEHQNDFWNLRNIFLSQSKVKEIINPLGNQISYATSGSKSSKTIAEINISGRKVSLFLYLPIKSNTTRNSVKVGRFIIVSNEGSNLFSLTASIDYLVLRPSGGLSLKEKADLSGAYKANFGKLTRGGFPKWCLTKNYIVQLGFFGHDRIVFEELYPDFVSANPTGWWEEFKTQETDKLGWFVDLAIRAWRYKI